METTMRMAAPAVGRVEPVLGTARRRACGSLSSVDGTFVASGRTSAYPTSSPAFGHIDVRTGPPWGKPV